MTSTMKSEPARPPSGESTFGSSVSAAICLAVGGSTEGAFAAATGGIAASAVDEAIVAPATAAPAKNFRRLTFGLASRLGFFRAIWVLPLRGHAGGRKPPLSSKHVTERQGGGR